MNNDEENLCVLFSCVGICFFPLFAFLHYRDLPPRGDLVRFFRKNGRGFLRFDAHSFQLSIEDA